MARTITQDRARREADLTRVEAALAAGTASPVLQFERARLLDELGAIEAARSAYLDVLRSDAGHSRALNALGQLLDRTGFRTAARSAFAQAVAAHPDDPLGHGNLGTSLLDGGEIDAARREYEIALRLDPDNVTAHACLAVLLLRLGDHAGATLHGARGFGGGATAWPFRGSAEPVPILVVHSALGGNVALDRYIDDRTFAKWTIVAEFHDPAVALPPHALVVNAIGDADRCSHALHATRGILALSRAPIINAPDDVLATSRSENARRLGTLPGVVAPQVTAFSRDELTGQTGADMLTAAGFRWPVILRSPGFQTGRHCRLITHPDQLTGAVAELPGDELLAIAFVDTRAADGTFRKYRVMVVDGEIFPLHLAISRQWMVHYYTADMAERADYRAADAAFLNDMPGMLGSHVMRALAAIASALRLAYGGIDFGIDAAGQVVMFEANATMIVPPPPREECWSYRQPAVRRIDDAVRALLLTNGGAPA
jgi:hypothetical protein